MLHKVDEIRGALLDAAVALAEGLDLGPDWDQDWKHGSGALVRSASDHPYFDFAPSTNWAQGGPIAIHGTNQPWSIGHSVSNGCIRLPNTVLERLFRGALAGTPVVIRR